jgi:hypothetical protein
MVHDTLTDRLADPAAMTAAFLRDTPDPNRFEGEFAAVVHDERRGVTWAINDHASLLHLYYLERAGVTYITTAPLLIARALGLGLNGAGVREFLWRGQVMCPNSLYAGVRRLGVGEHLRIRGGDVHVGRHWSPYRDPYPYRNKAAAAEATAQVALDVARRYARLGPVVSDLSGGYDSRFVACALAKVGATLTVTVNGHPQHSDVVLAKRVAQLAGWPIRHYGASVEGEMTAAVRREAACMSRGELGVLAFYLHLITRPQLARDHVVHTQGGGGEFLRYNPWGQEFTRIGRRERANVDRILRYRTLTGRAISNDVFAANFETTLHAELETSILTLIKDGAGTRTTQQLDAVFLLRMTGHFGGYTSSIYDLLPTGIPLMQRTALEHALSLPWRMRLSSGVLRRAIALLHPDAASIETTYGGTAAPPTLKTLPSEARQVLGRIRHFADKIDRVVLGTRVGRLVALASSEPIGSTPRFRTEEFTTFMTPSRLYSRGLYEPKALARLLSDPSTTTDALSRIATLEHMCRELDAQPGSELLRQ